MRAEPDHQVPPVLLRQQPLAWSEQEAVEGPVYHRLDQLHLQAGPEDQCLPCSTERFQEHPVVRPEGLEPTEQRCLKALA